MLDTNKKKTIEILFHIVAWILVLTSPLFMARELLLNDFELRYLAFFFIYIVLMIVFYVDYLLLIPKLLFKSKYVVFIAINIAVFVSSVYSIDYVHRQSRPPFRYKNEVEQVDKRTELTEKQKCTDRHRTFGRKKPIFWKFGLFHDALLLFFIILISILLRFTKKWFASIEERRELEKTKMEMELKNLKNQLNPHFLFNTLNNIYALIGISQDKAQQAVFDLSKLLRYVLYEGDSPFVSLENEVDFLQNYVKLMKLRLSSNVDVKTSFEIGNKGNSEIVQLLFIALVENAFKHGISLTNPSFVDIKMAVEDNNQLKFIVKNSYFPKSDNDKSGSGIGLENMKRRLDLLYPNSYVYNTDIANNTYTALLQIELK